MLNRVQGTDISRASTGVYIQEYPITLHMVGIGQRSRLNARCLPIGELDCRVITTECFLMSIEYTRNVYFVKHWSM